MQKIITFLVCLVYWVSAKNLSAQSSCDSLFMVDLTYKPARDIRITSDIIYFKKCNDTSSREIKIASKAIKAIIIEGKFIDIHPAKITTVEPFLPKNSVNNIVHDDTTQVWTFIRNSDQKKVNVYKGEKIELKLFMQLKESKVKGILLHINADSVFIMDKKKAVISVHKTAVTSIKLPKSGATAKKIIAVTVLLIGAGILLLFVLWWLVTGAFYTSKMRMENESKAGTGCLFIFLGIIGTIGIFYANRDREIKYPFSGEWRIENEAKSNNP